MKHPIVDILQSAFQIIYPTYCCICGDDLKGQERHVCATCSFDLPYITSDQEVVTKLNRLFWGRIEVQGIYTLFNYQKGNQVQTLLHTIKYKSRPVVARHFGKILAEHLPDQNRPQAILPIPLHPKKERLRGFNQSLAIAEGISQQLSLPIYRSHVIRNSANASQTKFSKYDRYENVRSIFTVTKPAELEGKHVLLVDDVLTTGATIESCARELLTVKDCSVSIATLAARV